MEWVDVSADAASGIETDGPLAPDAPLPIPCADRLPAEEPFERLPRAAELVEAELVGAEPVEAVPPLVLLGAPVPDTGPPPS